MAPARVRADVTAVVLSFNSLHTLRRVVAGILGGAAVPGRVIVVDNASTDGAAAWLLTQAPPSVESVLLRDNVGVGAGHMIGWRRALEDPACRWVWSLEHDAIPTAEALERLLASALAFPEPDRLALVRPRTYRDEADLAQKVGHYPDPAAQADLIETPVTSFNGPLLPRRVVEEHGQLREDFFLCLEDRAFSRALRAAGLTLLIDPSAVVWHDWGKRRLRASVARSYYSMRNAVYWQRYVIHARHVRLRCLLWTLGSYARTVFLDDRKLDRLRARWYAVHDGLRGDLGRKDYPFLCQGPRDHPVRLPCRTRAPLFDSSVRPGASSSRCRAPD